MKRPSFRRRLLCRFGFHYLNFRWWGACCYCDHWQRPQFHKD